MKKFLVVILFFAAIGLAQAQKVALKNNLLYDATATPNLALEFSMGKKTTLDLYGGFNPFQILSNNRKWKHWLAQPELRYWFCEAFNRGFIGIHGHVGQMNVGGIRVPEVGYITNRKQFQNMQNFRYQGWFAGAGASVGYHWILSDRFSLETSIGAGWVHLWFDKFNCPECGSKVAGDQKADYFGLTRATLSLVYLIK